MQKELEFLGVHNTSTWRFGSDDCSAEQLPEQKGLHTVLLFAGSSAKHARRRKV
jgi:hypothetical protein